MITITVLITIEKLTNKLFKEFAYNKVLRLLKSESWKLPAKN